MNEAIHDACDGKGPNLLREVIESAIRLPYSPQSVALVYPVGESYNYGDNYKVNNLR
jgi:hypothetical protein